MALKFYDVITSITYSVVGNKGISGKYVSKVMNGVIQIMEIYNMSHFMTNLKQNESLKAKYSLISFSSTKNETVS